LPRRRVGKFFGLARDDELVRIQRVLWLKGMPTHFFENYIPIDVAGDLSMKDLMKTKSVLKLLKNRIKFRIGRGEMFLRAAPLDPDVAEALKCNPLTPFILSEFYFWNEKDEPFEISVYFMKSEHFIYRGEIDVSDFDDI